MSAPLDRLKILFIANEAYICWFMDGATIIEALAARITVESKSSALP